MNLSTESENSSSYSCPPLKTCFENFPRHYHYDNFLLAFVFINALVALTAICFNFIVIYTISSTPSLRTPSNVLILGLAISDFGVGVITQPSYCIYLYSQYKRDIELILFVGDVYLTSWIFLAVASLLTVSFITADRFLAVYLHLRYNELVTNRRYCIVLALILFFCIFFSVSIMLVVNGKNIIRIVYYSLLFCVLLTNAFLIFKIWQVIRRHSRQIQAQQQSTQHLEQSINLPRYKKSVNTMYIVIGAFLLSYIPYIVALVTFIILQKLTLATSCLFKIGTTLVMFNGVLNPIIYCWRITDLRNATRQVVQKIWRRNCCN
jgi:hypothetical protein